MDFLEWIDAYKAQHGIKSDNEFSRLAGISGGLVSKWRSGKCAPSTLKLEQIADATGTDLSSILLSAAGYRHDDTYKDTLEDALTGVSGISVREGPASGDIRCIRLYSADAVTTGTEFNHRGEAGSGATINLVLPERFNDGGEYFALTLCDNNMAPELYSGDIVLVRRQNHASDGDTVVVCVGEGSAECAVIKHFDEGIVLNTPARVPGPVFFSNHRIRILPVTILGIVVDIQHREKI